MMEGRREALLVGRPRPALRSTGLQPGQRIQAVSSTEGRLECAQELWEAKESSVFLRQTLFSIECAGAGVATYGFAGSGRLVVGLSRPADPPSRPTLWDTGKTRAPQELTILLSRSQRPMKR